MIDHFKKGTIIQLKTLIPIIQHSLQETNKVKEINLVRGHQPINGIDSIVNLPWTVDMILNQVLYQNIGAAGANPIQMDMGEVKEVIKFNPRKTDTLREMVATLAEIRQDISLIIKLLKILFSKMSCL